MSKVITDLEVYEIIGKVICEAEIDDLDQYGHFLAGLGELIADHFGGKFLLVSPPLDEEAANDIGKHCLHFEWDECVPGDGGIYAQYDTEKSIKEWMEEAK